MENIRVLVRVRPFLPNEELRSCVTVRGNQIIVGDERQFAFDGIFDMEATSEEVNSAVAAPLVSSYVNGYTVSTIAYGQTGAGKTYTMSSLSLDVVHRASAALKKNASSSVDGGGSGEKPEFRFSAVEVYNENISDLLAASSGSSSSPLASMTSVTSSLPLREDARCGVYIQGLSEVVVDNEEELLMWVEKTPVNRRTASTLMNATSSRSHCLLTITLTYNGIVSRFGLVDLAGSERIKKAYDRKFTTGVMEDVGDERNPLQINEKTKSSEVASRMREGISINSGLLALGNVIVALCKRKAHVPYRTSKLTRLLQPMLSGNSKTTIIACVSPDISSFEETLNTLKYAYRAKSIRTTPFQVASCGSSLEEAEKTILWLRRQLEIAQQQQWQSQEVQSPKMYSFTGADEVRLQELQELLASERKLTRRLQEDLFNAEYTAMIEIEKSKKLEKRILEFETPQQRGNSESMEVDTTPGSNDPPHLSSAVAAGTVEKSKGGRGEEGGGDVNGTEQTPPHAHIHSLHNGMPVLREHNGTDYDTASGSNNNLDDSVLEELSREIESKERVIHHLIRHNEEAVLELEHTKQRQQEMQDVKRHLEEELSRAEAKLEETEMEKQKKDDERRKLRAYYELRLRKAEEEATEYRRKVQEATTLVTVREVNMDMIKQLQSQVVEMSDELNRQRHAVREGQQRFRKMAASHSQEMNHLQKQLRESEAQVAKLQVQLQKKEREIARAKKSGTNSNNNNNNSVCGGNSRRQNASPRLHSQGAQSASLSEDVQKEIDVELMKLANLEKEVDELATESVELKNILSEAQKRTGETSKWKKAMKGFSMRLQHLEKELQSDALSDQFRSRYTSEKASIEEKMRQLQAFESVFRQTSKQLAEMDSSIDSLQEARKYHLRRVRQLQNGCLMSGDKSNRMTSELL